MPLLLLLLAITAASARDIRSVEPDLQAPAMQNAAPAPGLRVRQTLAEFAGTEVYHSLYLPTDWKPDQRYPVIVEYAGNGPYHNKLGDISTGKVEGSKMGFGLSGGSGYIWLCLPYLNNAGDANVTQWWGTRPKRDPGPTLAYCQAATTDICERYGGDPKQLILCGFSRGAIAVNYLGLHNDDVAPLWQAFIAFSHYDGVRKWGYGLDDRDSARSRLARLKGRPQFICAESANNLNGTRTFIEESKIDGNFTFRLTGFRNHDDAWLLRPSEARRELRNWLQKLR